MRADLAVAALLAALVCGAGWARLVPGVTGAFHDDAVYAVTAKALAEGRGYRLVNLPGAPPQTKYPILYPAALALVWKAVPTLDARLTAMKLVTLAAAALAIATAYLYVVRFTATGRVAACAAGAVCASAPNVLYYATQILSEMPFALALVGALWAADAARRAPATTPLRDVGTGIALALPFLCRTVGIVVPLAAAGILALAGHRIRWIAAGAVGAMLPWLVWMLGGVGGMASDPVLGYQRDYLGHWSTGYFGATHESWILLAMRVAAANVGKAWAAFGDIGFEGMAREVYARVGWAPAAMIALGAVPWLGIALQARARAVLPTVLLAYLVLVCCWPWPPDRFIVPVLFFLMASLWTLLERGVARVAGSRAIARAVVAFAAAAVVASNLLALRAYASVARDSHYPYFVLPGEPVSWSSYEQAFAWLRARSDPADVLAAGFDSMTALYTERATIRPFVPRPSTLYYGHAGSALGEPAELTAALRAHHVRYLLLAPMPAFPEEEAFYALVSDARRTHPGALVPVYRGSDSRFVVFEFRDGA